MLFGALPAIVLWSEIVYFTGFHEKAGSFVYMLVNGAIVGGSVYFFRRKPMPANTFVQRHTSDLLRLGMVACVQSVIFLALYLFTD
jgi:hypothetical protein